jgi:opacity protein-like surface antigen
MQSTRNRFSQRLALVVALVFLGASGAQAQDQDEEADADTTRSGPYVGLAVAGGIPTFDGGELFTITTPSKGRVNEETSVGINARLGWRFLPWAAAEIQYEWMNDFVVETRGAECLKVKSQVLTGNLKLYAPHHSFHPYALAGVGVGRYQQEARTIALASASCGPNPGDHSNQRDWELAARFGLGVDLYLNEHILLNIEGTGVYSDERLLESPWAYVSIAAGIQYRF